MVFPATLGEEMFTDYDKNQVSQAQTNQPLTCEAQNDWEVFGFT